MLKDPIYPLWQAFMIGAVDANSRAAQSVRKDFIAGRMSLEEMRETRARQDTALDKRLAKIEASFYGER